MKLGVVIPYYNGAKFIARCLDTIEPSSLSDVFVVDNSEDPADISKKVQLIRSEESKIGFGAAVNLGLEKVYESTYDYVLVLNQDAYFAQGHFQKLVDYLENNILDRFASPMIYKEDLQAEMPFIMERYFPNGSPTEAKDIDDFVGVALIAPVVLMKSLRGFDTRYFMYYEDNDIIARSGIEKPVRILPCVHVAHHNPELLDDSPMPIEKQRWQRRSELRYQWKHGNRLNWFISMIKHVIKLALGK